MIKKENHLRVAIHHMAHALYELQQAGCTDLAIYQDTILEMTEQDHAELIATHFPVTVRK